MDKETKVLVKTVGNLRRKNALDVSADGRPGKTGLYFLGARGSCAVCVDLLDPIAWGRAWADELSLDKFAFQWLETEFDNPNLSPAQRLGDMFRELIKTKFEKTELLETKLTGKDKKKCVASKTSQDAGYGWNASLYTSLVKPFVSARLGVLGTVPFGRPEEKAVLVCKGQGFWIAIAPKDLAEKTS